MSNMTDKPGQTTELVMRDWLLRLEKRGEPKPSVGTYNATFEAIYAAFNETQCGGFCRAADLKRT